jgi:tRNA (adenine37-N6)-methyltransferase
MMQSAVREFVLRPIGVIRSPFQGQAGTPIQPIFAGDAEGRVIVDPGYESALADIEGFERIWLLYWFDRAAVFASRVRPYRDDRDHGLFATRAPSRPNPLGLSAVRLLARDGNVLRVSGIDVLDSTPLLDIKPYIPEVDAQPASLAGWWDERQVAEHVADGRFEPK